MGRKQLVDQIWQVLALCRLTGIIYFDASRSSNIKNYAANVSFVAFYGLFAYCFARFIRINYNSAELGRTGNTIFLVASTMLLTARIVYYSLKRKAMERLIFQVTVNAALDTNLQRNYTTLFALAD